MDTDLFEDLVQSIKEMKAIERGELTGSTKVMNASDVKEMRGTDQRKILKPFQKR